MADILRAMDDKRSIFFDLDGTLTDPYLGIQRCIDYALDALGEPLQDDYRWAVGPPLRQSFADMVGESLADRALAAYRERYADTGWSENTPYAGVHDALDALRSAGHRLFVATSKPHIFARRILEHFDLLELFEQVYGAELDGTRGDKTSLLAYALDRQRGLVAPVMIGDRRFDIEGAHANGLPAWGVLYGYGTREELQRAGAERLLHCISDLPGVVDG